MTEFPYDWLAQEALRRVPRFFPTGLVGWASIASSTLLAATNVWYRWESKKSRRETSLLRQEVRQLIAGNAYPMADITFIAARNYTKGRLLWSPKFVVVHWTAGTFDDTVRYFQTTKKEVSAHLVIKDSRVIQMVKFDDTAWHAGNWLANLQSIGIEHEGGPNLPISNETYQTSANVIAEIHKRYGWGEPTPLTVRPHSAFRPTACPGNLDIARLIVMANEAYHPRTVHVPVEYVPAEAHPEEKGDTFAYAPFTRNLAPSQVHDDEVGRMQQYLVDAGFMKASDLVDESGKSMKGYYGKRTQTAVDRFQKAVGIAKATKYGWWYDKTREAANHRLTVSKQPTVVN